MQKLYENFHIFHFQKRIVSTEIIRENTVYICDLPLFCHHDDRYCHQNYCVIFFDYYGNATQASYQKVACLGQHHKKTVFE